MTASIIEVLTVSEAARRLGSCRNTLARRIERVGILPDALLHEGHTGKPSPLFLTARLPELGRLLTNHPKITV